MSHTKSQTFQHYRALVALALFPCMAACAESGAKRLSSEQIKSTFADVKDIATIQDAQGSSAVNYWYANGTFTNEWANAKHSGAVSGTWYAKNNKRCVLITKGMASIKGQTRCGPIFLEDGVYKSFNADGSVHAEHVLSKLQ